MIPCLALRKRHLALLLLVTAGLAGCGFRLVGSDSLPPELKNVTVQPERGLQAAEPPVAVALRQVLARRGAAVETRAEASSAVIRLSKVSDYREIIALGTDGKALEYRLVQSVAYDLRQNGIVLAGPDVVTVSRDYSFKINQVLATEQEEQELRQYLQQQLANLVLLRIENTLHHQRVSAGDLQPVVGPPLPQPAPDATPVAAPAADVPALAAPPVVSPSADQPASQ